MRRDISISRTGNQGPQNNSSVQNPNTCLEANISIPKQIPISKKNVDRGQKTYCQSIDLCILVLVDRTLKQLPFTMTFSIITKQLSSGYIDLEQGLQHSHSRTSQSIKMLLMLCDSQISLGTLPAKLVPRNPIESV